MTKRKALASLLACIALLGAGFAIVPLVASLGPSAKARAAHEHRIPLADIPNGSYKEIVWGYRRVFVGNVGGLRAFVMPYMNGAYMLPDPTWDRASIPCSSFEFIDSQFQCTDPNADLWLRTNLRWNAAGDSLNQPYVSLQVQPFIMRGGEVILGGEA